MVKFAKLSLEGLALCLIRQNDCLQLTDGGVHKVVLLELLCVVAYSTSAVQLAIGCGALAMLSHQIVGHDPDSSGILESLETG